jgi:hypothetical protein
MGKYFSAWKDSVAYLFDASGKTVFQRNGGAVTYLFDNFAVIDGEGFFNWKTQQRVWSPCSSISIIDGGSCICIDDETSLLYLLDTLGHHLGTYSYLYFYREGSRSPAYFISKQSRLMIASEPVSGKYGIIDLQGKWVAPPTHKRITILDEDVYVVEEEKGAFADPDLAMLKINGDTLLPFGHKKIWYMGNHKYYLEHVSRTGIFDLSTGLFSSLPKDVTCSQTRTYENEHFLVISKAEKMGLSDGNLKTILEPEFDRIDTITPYGVVVGAYGKMGVIKR